MRMPFRLLSLDSHRYLNINRCVARVFWSLLGISLVVTGLIFWHKAVPKPVIVLGEKGMAFANKLTKARKI